MLNVVLYTRKDCYLCDQVEEELLTLQKDIPHKLIKIDIAESSSLTKEFGTKIPVVEVGPYKVSAPIDPRKLQATLGAARDREQQIAQIEDIAVADRKGNQYSITKTDKVLHWFAKHYLMVFNLFWLLYIGLPVLAPTLMNAGYEVPAKGIYRIYSGLCHQLSFRSWFLFGEQSLYPREVAGLDGLMTYSDATGFDGDDVFTARQFLGNEVIGYKIGLCQRDMAIYSGLLLFGVVFGLSKRKQKSFPLLLWVLIGMVPIGLDGVSQILSQPPLNFIPLRESTPLLRTITGFLFGFTTAWFGYPLVEETMIDVQNLLARKFAKIKQLS